MKYQLNKTMLLLIYVVGAALVIGAVVLLFQLDRVINVSLYEYGLQFNYEWATPYWTFLRLAVGLLGCAAGLNFFSMVYMIFSHRASCKSGAPLTRPSVSIQPKQSEREKTSAENGVEVAALPMVCSKCGKVFTQPLCMFDFKSGKPRLVNVCPYCNAILAVSGNSRMK